RAGSRLQILLDRGVFDFTRLTPVKRVVPSRISKLVMSSPNMIMSPAMKQVMVCIGLMFATAAFARGPASAAELPWLHAEETQVVDDQGRPVVLRGVNLGGWLVEEMWMMPFQTKPPHGTKLPEVKDHISLWRTIAQRLGATERDRLR